MQLFVCLFDMFVHTSPLPSLPQTQAQRCAQSITCLFSFQVMERDAALMRQGGPTIFAQAKHLVGVPKIADYIVKAYKSAVTQ